MVGLVEQPAGATAVAVLPTRWIAERTFARLGRDRGLGKDNETLPATSEARTRIAMIRLMPKRLAPR